MKQFSLKQGLVSCEPPKNRLKRHVECAGLLQGEKQNSNSFRKLIKCVGKRRERMILMSFSTIYIELYQLRSFSYI